MLTPEQLAQIHEVRLAMQGRFRSVPPEGHDVEYLGKRFKVYNGVFWPFDDSKPLVENFTIHPGETVLDVCTGSGVIAIFAVLKGAKKVVALDISPDAVRCATENVKRYGLEDVIDVRCSDVFRALTDNEQFDVITGNFPFTPDTAMDAVEATQCDTGLHVHRVFFAQVHRHLMPGGRVYLAQANFGAVEEMKRLAHAAGFVTRKIGQIKMPHDARIYYAFELTKKSPGPRREVPRTTGMRCPLARAGGREPEQ